ncbi:HYES hydrolase, partial [Pomatostomus ruficeps]|nr:HYES hydrolase [Pomatostomus ruficeps]
GFRTCLLADAWLDDGAGRFRAAALRERLRSHFDLVLESCRVGMSGTDPGIYRHALEQLRARPREV